MRQPPRIRTRVSVTIEGHHLTFRPLTSAEIKQTSADLDARPEESLLIAEAACKAACLCSTDDFEAAAEDYPLMWQEVLDSLTARGIEEAQARIDKGVRLWRGGDRNYGRLAPHLLAFNAYDGGDYTESEFAGAMAQAELIGTVKGIFQLMQAYLKSQRR